MNRRYLFGPQQNYIGGPFKKNRWEWRDVPADYKTRRRWERAGRKVKEGEKPHAAAVYPRWLSDDERAIVGACDPQVLNYEEWGILVTDSTTPLFHVDQTKPYKPNARTLAYFAYEDVFFKQSQRGCWIKKTERDGSERDWFTIREDQAAEFFSQAEILTEDIVRSHLNGTHMVGVRATEKTNWVKIDLDFHGRDLQVFERQAEVLLEVFYGGGWHYEVKREDVSGLGLLKVFDKPTSTKAVHAEYRQILRQLDSQHPELAEAARTAGMKTLGELEIYPSQIAGTRLPLCRDRVVFLDKPLPLVTYRKKQVQDVETYIAWLNDPNRTYMPKEKILGYLHYHAWPSEKSKAESVSVDWANGEIAPGGWHGNTRRFLHDFWLKGNANGKPLNEHIAVLARFSARYGYSVEMIVERLTALVNELPASARTCSSRLLNGRFDKIEAIIRTTAKYACVGNNHQADPTLSSQKIDLALRAWPEFDPLDKATWLLRKPVQKSNLVPEWSDEMRRGLVAYFRKPLFVKDEQVIIRFLDGIINLTIDKEEQSQGWGKDYLGVWMKDHFPEIKSAKPEKRHKIMKALETTGIIRLTSRGFQGRTCSKWTLGLTAKRALGMVEDQDRALLSELAEQFPLKASISSRSLFWEKLDSDGQRAMIEVVGETFGPATEPQSGVERPYAALAASQLRT